MYIFNRVADVSYWVLQNTWQNLKYPVLGIKIQNKLPKTEKNTRANHALSPKPSQLLKRLVI